MVAMIHCSRSLIIDICHISMSLHIPLSHLHWECNFTSSLHSWYLAALCLGDQLWIIDKETCALSESTEELQTAIMLNWSEHADGLLNDAGLNGYVCASVGLDILITIWIQVGTINDNLRPSMRIHWAISDLKGQIPYHSLCMDWSIGALKSMLSLAWLVTARNIPVGSRHEVILDG